MELVFIPVLRNREVSAVLGQFTLFFSAVGVFFSAEVLGTQIRIPLMSIRRGFGFIIAFPSP
jgi:hypothetical protein